MPVRRLAPLLLLWLLLAHPPVADALTRKQADKAAAAALHVTRMRGPAVLFGLRAPLRKGQIVTEAARGAARSGTVSRAGDTERYVATDASASRRRWLYWLDLAPRARFEHPSVLLLLDDRGGKVVLRRTLSWWPLIDGKRPAFLAGPAAYERAAYRVFAKGDRRGSARTGVFAGGPLQSAAQRAVTGPPNVANDCVIHLGDRADPQFGGDFNAVRQITDAFRLPRTEAISAADLDAKISAFEGADPRCTDVVIWISAHGYPAVGSNFKHPSAPGNIPESANAQVALARKVTVVNLRGRRSTQAVTTLLDSAMVRAVLAKHPSTTFKLVVDACFSGRWRELADVANLRVILAASRNDQMSFGYIPNGEYPVTSQTNATFASPGGMVTINVNNPTQGGNFTNAIARGLDAWGQSAEQRAKDGEDLAKGLVFAFNGSATRDASQLEGLTRPQIADMTVQRPHGQPPAAAAPPLTATLEVSYRHVGPGDSEVCVRVRTSPPKAGNAHIAVTGPGVVSGADQNVAVGPDGLSPIVRVKINQYGSYTAGAEVGAADGGSANAVGEVTVTADQGACPAP